MSEKRPLSPDRSSAGGAIVVKKPRTDQQLVTASAALPPGVPEGYRRTSKLHAPIMKLTGHGDAVLSMKFSPDGESIASGSADKLIFLWKTYGECENYMMLKGHRNAILEVHWFQHGDTLLSASADKTVRCWDAMAGLQIKKVTEHTGIVNSCAPLRRGSPLFVSGSDDKQIKTWDLRIKRSTSTMTDKHQVTAVSYADAGDQVYSGGIDNTIKVWDLRKEAMLMTLRGHSDTITGMSLSPDGTHLLTNAMDNTLRMWDMRPFAPANRCVKVFTGHLHNFEKNLLRCAWSADGSKVTAGSADRMVYIWDCNQCRILYKLPGHLGSVNESVFHPIEPIIGSCSSDKSIYLGEIAL